LKALQRLRKLSRAGRPDQQQHHPSRSFQPQVPA
jgi:hypothetical protein